MMDKFQDKNLENSLKIQQLSLNYASENSFLSLLRTAGILAGVAGILIRLKKATIFVTIFLILLLLSIIYTSYKYYNYINKKNTFQTDIAHTIGMNSILLASLLCIILFIMIIITFMHY